MSEETLVYFGDAIKALDDNGKVGGYLVRFTSPAEKDLEQEYFSQKTYFGAGNGNDRDVLFHHGLPVKKGLEGLADHVFAPMKTRKDDLGIWAETVLDQSNEYESLVFKLVKAGKIGWSSGSSPHLVKKAADGHLDRWIISEGSLTHMPVDPLARARSIKSLDTSAVIEEIETVLHEDDEPETKGILLEGLPALRQVVSPAVLSKGLQAHSASVEAAVKEFLTHGEIMGDVLKAHAIRVEDKVRFRFEQKGYVPTSNLQHIAAMVKDLDAMSEGFAAIRSDLKRIQDEPAQLRSQSETEAARFELQNFLRISGNQPKELKR